MQRKVIVQKLWMTWMHRAGCTTESSTLCGSVSDPPVNQMYRYFRQIQQQKFKVCLRVGQILRKTCNLKSYPLCINERRARKLDVPILFGKSRNKKSEGLSRAETAQKRMPQRHIALICQLQASHTTDLRCVSPFKKP